MKNYLLSIGILTQSEIDEVISYTKRKSLKKNDFLIKEGQICNEVVFVESGILRSFFSSPSGEETTYCFTFPQRLSAAYTSFITKEETQENIQCITPVELLVLPSDKFHEFAENNIRWVKLLKLFAEENYIELEKRVFQLQRETAKKRYTDLILNQPEYIQQIPLQYLASYLGISQRHLSRLRKELSF